MNDVVYLKLPRPDPEAVARASRITVSDLYEALPAESRDSALMNSRIRPLISGVRVAGPAVTARCAPNDNLMMHKALQIAEPGDVIVVDGGTPSAAQWGYLAAVYAEKKGISGVVVEGCIRDVDARSSNTALLSGSGRFHPPIRRRRGPEPSTSRCDAATSWSGPEIWCAPTRMESWSCAGRTSRRSWPLPNAGQATRQPRWRPSRPGNPCSTYMVSRPPSKRAARESSTAPGPTKAISP